MKTIEKMWRIKLARRIRFFCVSWSNLTPESKSEWRLPGSSDFFKLIAREFN